jgi:hypothetical protein
MFVILPNISFHYPIIALIITIPNAHTFIINNVAANVPNVYFTTNSVFIYYWF